MSLNSTKNWTTRELINGHRRLFKFITDILDANNWEKFNRIIKNMQIMNKIQNNKLIWDTT